jgi:hypothetical protein
MLWKSSADYQALVWQRWVNGVNWLRCQANPEAPFCQLDSAVSPLRAQIKTRTANAMLTVAASNPSTCAQAVQGVGDAPMTTGACPLASDGTANLFYVTYEPATHYLRTKAAVDPSNNEYCFIAFAPSGKNISGAITSQCGKLSSTNQGSGSASFTWSLMEASDSSGVYFQAADGPFNGQCLSAKSATLPSGRQFNYMGPDTCTHPTIFNYLNIQ